MTSHKCLGAFSCLCSRYLAGPASYKMDLLRKSGEFFYLKEDLDDEAEAANEGI
jgi:hypothetical protein